MPMDEDELLHFRAVVLDDEATTWTAPVVAHVVDALANVGVVPDDGADPEVWASTAGNEEPIAFSGTAGGYELLLEGSGGWWWDTPYATLMQGRHTNRPEAVDELVAAVRSVLGVVPPLYYGCSWLSNQGPPLWMRTTDPFAAWDAATLQFFGPRYLDTHCGGRPYANPPGTSVLVNGGQLVVADPPAFGEAVVVGVGEITDYLQQHGRAERSS